MSQSLDYVLLHLVFSTKERYPFLSDSVRDKMHAYLATVARDKGCACHRVGGIADHIHIAVQLSRTITIAQLVEALKTSSSRWIKRQAPEFAKFAWQRGYGIFSVRPTDDAILLSYIDNQEKHHRVKTFQEEYRAFLNKYGIAFDERYVWD
jgi:putative transposase